MEGGQGSEGQNELFNLGAKTAVGTTQDKKKQIENTGESRLAQTLSIKDDSKRDQKRERDDYAVNLRKKKKDELQKRRRGFQTSQNSTNEQAQADGMAGVANANQNADGIDPALDVKNWTIDQALQYAKTSGVDLENFIHKVAQQMKFQVQDFNLLVKLINSDDVTTKLFACVGMRKLLSIENIPPIQAVIDANLVPVFINLLHNQIPKFQFEAAWCLTNIASGTTDHVNNLIEKDVLSHFIYLLSSSHIEVVEQVIWGIGNIAGDSPLTRDSVIHSGALEKIAAVVDKAVAGTSFMRNASWALSNLCRGRPQPDYALVRKAIPTLIKVLVNNDREDIITDVCWALSYLSDGAKDKIDDLVDPNLLKKCIQLLLNENAAISIPCLRTIGNIVTGDDNQTQMAVDAGLVGALNVIITHNKKTVRKEACWVLSNITAGNQQQVQICIDTGIVDKLIQILQHDELPVKSEAVWALSNTTASASPEQFQVLVQKGIMKALGGVLKVNDVKMLAVALEGLENILKCGQLNFLDENGENKFAIQMEMDGSIDDLEELQQHPNHNIYNQALKIIDTYFNEDAQNDPLLNAILQAQSNSGQQQTPMNESAGLFDL